MRTERAKGRSGWSTGLGLAAQLGLASMLFALGACSVYDSKLLQLQPAIDAATLDAGMSRKDAQAPDRSDPAKQPDAGKARDAGAAHDAGSDAQIRGDAAAGDPSDDGSVEIVSDAGCLSSDNLKGVDCCPDDPFKTEAGACGCGKSETDADADGVPDCTDGCPSDKTKSDPGVCGCGLSDDEAEGCAGLKATLAHRYRFGGTGTVASDSIASADGTVVNAQLSNAGSLALAGGTTDQYVDLPNSLVSSLKNATFEVWLTWNGGAVWQRIFDFGDPTSGGEGARASGRSYLFLTASSGATGNPVRAAYKRNGSNEVAADASKPLVSGALAHVAVVVDDDNNLLSVYIDGALEKSAALADSLSDINDINNWIGRSQFSSDPGLNATVQEFRIYNAALSAAQLATSFHLGPDPAFLDP